MGQAYNLCQYLYLFHYVLICFACCFSATLQNKHICIMRILKNFPSTDDIQNYVHNSGKLIITTRTLSKNHCVGGQRVCKGFKRQTGRLILGDTCAVNFEHNLFIIQYDGIELENDTNNKLILNCSPTDRLTRLFLTLSISI